MALWLDDPRFVAYRAQVVLSLIIIFCYLRVFNWLNASRTLGVFSVILLGPQVDSAGFAAAGGTAQRRRFRPAQRRSCCGVHHPGSSSCVT